MLAISLKIILLLISSYDYHRKSTGIATSKLAKKSCVFLFYKSLKIFATTTPLPFMPGSKVAVADFFKTLKTEFQYLLLPQNQRLHFSYRTSCLL